MARLDLPTAARAAGLALWLATTGWYPAVQAHGFRRLLGVGPWRGLTIAVGLLLLGPISV